MLYYRNATTIYQPQETNFMTDEPTQTPKNSPNSNLPPFLRPHFLGFARAHSLMRGFVAGYVLFTLTVATAQETSSTADVVMVVSEPLQSTLEELRTKYQLPGLIAGQFYCDPSNSNKQPSKRPPAPISLTIAATGFRRSGSQAPLLIDDPFHLGSCTKSMTATLVAMAIERGDLRWNSTIGEVFSNDSKITNSPWAGVTVEQLMRHTSGAPANPPWNHFRDPSIKTHTHRIAVLHWWMDQPPPTSSDNPPTQQNAFLYSNLGYMALGTILENIYQQPWEEIISKQLFEPLSMSHTGFGVPSKTLGDQVPFGHIRPLNLLLAVEQDNPPALGPAGTVYAPMSDWVKYLNLHMRNPTSQETQKRLGLSPQAMDFLHLPAKPSDKNSPSKPGEDYAGGWHVIDRSWSRGKILHHNGSNTYWYCVVFLAPEEGRGIFAASNLGLDAAKPCDEALQWMLKNLPLTPTE